MDQLLAFVKRVPPGPVVAVGFVLMIFAMSRSVTATAFTPDVKGLSSADAQARVVDGGFTPMIETRVQGGVAGTVVEQDPSPGEALARGGTVTIFVTKGARQVTVPDVKGMPVDQARQVLRQARLEPGDVVYRNEPSREPDRVISTNPVAGRSVDEATRVEIVAVAP
jgi:serine/threonine-protein kinase